MTKFLAEVTGRARSGVLLRPELLLLGGGRGGRVDHWQQGPYWNIRDSYTGGGLGLSPGARFPPDRGCEIWDSLG